MDNTASELDGGGYDEITTLLRKLRINPAVEPAKLGHLAGKSTPGWMWC